MLRTLSIRDFVIVDTLELDFGQGFSVLTGETGAGKSILVDALALVLGGRGDASVVREGASRADISLEFASDDAIDRWLEANGFTHDDDSVLLRRTLDSNGRSRCFVNGSAATAAQVRELGEHLVDIHGQHAHQSLLKSSHQRELLDRHAGLHDLASAVADAYATWQQQAQQCRDFEANAQTYAAQREHLEWQVNELDRLAPRTGEWSDITQEHNRLSHAASLIAGAQEAMAVLADSEQPLISQLFLLHQKLSRLSDVDDALKPVLDFIESARIQLQEASYTLNHYLSKVELDPQRLQQVETRMEAIYAAARKFRVVPEDLPAAWTQLAAQLTQLAPADNLDELRRQEAAALDAYRKVANRLSAGRAAAATELGEAVTRAMQELSMEGGSFAVELPPCEPGMHGVEQVEFTVAGHAGAARRPLAKVASGGELARIALAISVITSNATATPTLIFDEVDSGIGGAVAEVVGRLLKRLSEAHQVLCVTHLPQVASLAHQHFQVSKQADDAGKPISRIDLLDAPSRIEEIARMLGGLEITTTTRQHAKEMLSQG